MIFSKKEEKKEIVDPNVKITTTIPNSKRNLANLHGWAFNELLLLGIETKQNMPKMLDRINELESGNDKLQKKLTVYAERQFELESKLSEITTLIKKQELGLK